MTETGPTTFRELLQYVRTSERPVKIRFAVLMATLAICGALLAAEVIFLAVRSLTG